MKNSLLLIGFLLSYWTGFTQCTVHPLIEENYQEDAYTLLFREFIGDPSHPNYDIPIISTDETVLYLERLSAIYEEAPNNQSIDSLFNYFQIHTNAFFPKIVPFGESIIWIPEETSWLWQFINTGISGNQDLDELMATYQFEIIEVGIVEPPPVHFISLSSPIPYLNTYALIDDFEAVDGIDFAEVGFPEVLYNYTGTYFEIDGEEVRATNIEQTDNGFIFSLHVGPCWTTCDISKGWNVTVSEDCETITIESLGIEKINLPRIAVFPNPSGSHIYIESGTFMIKSVKIFDMNGRIISLAPLGMNRIDISNLSAGSYLFSLETMEGQIVTKHIIKQ